ncbi:YhjD/YihY/BrkB family envelope integrity protein [Escherichia coli]
MLRIFPLLLSWISFWLLYSIVPTIRVPNRDAIVGAFVAALLFEAGRRFRALYHHVPVISAHLRCAGGDPHSLCLGLYWTWCIVLLGAEITVTLWGIPQTKTSS